jgi:hypothetical protein
MEFHQHTVQQSLEVLRTLNFEKTHSRNSKTKKTFHSQSALIRLQIFMFLETPYRLLVRIVDSFLARSCANTCSSQSAALHRTKAPLGFTPLMFLVHAMGMAMTESGVCRRARLHRIISFRVHIDIIAAIVVAIAALGLQS